MTSSPAVPLYSRNYTFYVDGGTKELYRFMYSHLLIEKNFNTGGGVKAAMQLNLPGWITP